MANTIGPRTDYRHYLYRMADRNDYFYAKGLYVALPVLAKIANMPHEMKEDMAKNFKGWKKGEAYKDELPLNKEGSKERTRRLIYWAEEMKGKFIGESSSNLKSTRNPHPKKDG